MGHPARHECISEMFQAQAARTPDVVAVMHGREALTYRELDARASALAGVLRGAGAGPETVVGICAWKSIEMVVAVLATLKAGGAYTSLDPALPDARLTWMARDCGAVAVLTTRELAPRLPDVSRVIRLDVDEDVDAGVDLAEPVTHRTDRESPVYVIYTSGSTGQPKSIAMVHRAAVNLVEWEVQRSSLPAGARTLQFASLSFDVSFQEIFATLCGGGTLVLLPEALKRDAARLLAFVDEHQVQRLYLPVVALEQLAKAATAARRAPRSLRTIIVAGDRLQVTGAVRSFFERLPPGATLENQYGPSETIQVTSFILQGAPAGG
ncbi:MAG TPA: AMP-binding protein, partial [Myxococcales bacterium]|nr:AMP-binding protein [Myxococcales bacterium]